MTPLLARLERPTKKPYRAHLMMIKEFHRFFFDKVVFFGLFVWWLSCLGVAEAKTSLDVNIGNAIVKIKADNVPLHVILKVISEKTGLYLKLGKPLTDSITCDLETPTLEEALQRLLANHSHTLTYVKTADDRFLPVEIRVVGEGVSTPVAVQGQPVPVVKLPPPEDPYEKKVEREWFMKQFVQPNRLASEIKTVQYKNGSVADGIIITEISKDSSLHKLDLKVGDVIKNVNGETVNSTPDFLNRLSSLPTDRSSMRIERDRDNRAAPVYIRLQ